MKKIINNIKKKIKNKKIEAIENDLNISYCLGFTINNLQVSEFNYLFDYILHQANLKKDMSLDMSFLDRIVEKKNEIFTALDIELSKNPLREQERSNISYETAKYNLDNLKTILETMCKYHEELTKENLTIKG